jgi:mannose-6-phosphate isomerase-like protein (cupin superfamily)
MRTTLPVGSSTTICERPGLADGLLTHLDAGCGVSAFCMYYGDRGDQSDWELHPDTDELLMVLEGSVTVEILTAPDRHRLPLTAGQFTVVPKGHWHRHTDAHDVIEMFYTPGSTLESSADDPRVASPESFVPDETPARSERSGA